MSYSDTEAADECGEAYEHDLRYLGKVDGLAVYECRQCGAEVESEEDGED